MFFYIILDCRKRKIKVDFVFHKLLFLKHLLYRLRRNLIQKMFYML